MARRILRLPKVEDITGWKRSSIYAGMAEGTFPAQIPLGARAVGWNEDEVDAWIEARIAEAEAHASMHIDKAPEEIGTTPEKLQPFIESGELPTFKVGRHKLVKKTVLAAFSKKHAAAFHAQAA